jgi:hypothetical protein
MTGQVSTLANRFRPRYVEPANIEVDDVVRVSWNAGGIEHQRTARVHRIFTEGPAIVLYTEEGHEILHYIIGARRNVKVVILGRTNNVSELSELIGLAGL